MKEKTAGAPSAKANAEKAISPVDLTADSMHEARLTRLYDYLTRSLKKDDALEANLGSINSGLMRVALWLEEAIEAAIASGTPDIQRLKRLLPTVDTQLRVTRQIDRFAQIEARVTESRRPKRSNNRNRTRIQDAAQGHAVISQSEEIAF